MASYRARVAEAKKQTRHADEHYFAESAIKTRRRNQRDFNLLLTDGDEGRAISLKIIPVLDYLAKVDKFTLELKAQIEIQRNRRNGKRR